MPRCRSRRTSSKGPNVAANYKETMNLPKTDFPMRASLAMREPERIKRWEEIDLFGQNLARREGGEPYILHDGPPYANGHIHMGTTYNKILKDVIVRYKSLRGHFAPYVPGWDCHGQPIEHMVEKELGPVKMAQTSKAELRGLCRDWATRFIDVQRDEFRRLGVQGDWQNPYLTYTPQYEAGIVEVFKTIYESGAIYRGRKPIHWCTRCHTALAEAEIEYSDEVSPSIHVALELITPLAPFASASDLPQALLIWTTTPWTLPANVAVAVSPEAVYVGMQHEGRLLVVARELVAAVASALGIEDPELALDGEGNPVEISGEDLLEAEYRRPIFPENTGVVIGGEHVELGVGTGLVHTAPGHGDEDYLVATREGLEILMPVDDNGVFTAGGGPFVGVDIDTANPMIIEWLRERGALVASSRLDHSYPHCWRCHRPVIYRATDQWFVSMSDTDLRKKAVDAIDTQVDWLPSWSINRIGAMVADRPDWTISRQRAWGVPIPVFSCAECEETVATPETFDAVIDLFAREGADAWFIRDPKEYLPEGTACSKCGSDHLLPEDDILDVWWESGVSHTSVLKAREELQYPADLYLEGSDQHRGWFQSSLLTSVAAYGRAPYKGVLTHGFVVDADGRKMSKSLGNVISPIDLLDSFGAEIMRLWMAASDYGQDIAISDEILQRTSEAYRRIRNTFRFLLSTLFDFDPVKNAVADADLLELDRLALARVDALIVAVTEAYDAYRFHVVYRLVYEFVTDISAEYLDAIKDRTYSDGADWLGRRSAQTVVHRMLSALVRLLAPILAFTTDEVWEYMDASDTEGLDSVQLADWPTVSQLADRDELLKRSAVLMEIREVITKSLEDARNAKVIGKSQEAAVTVGLPSTLFVHASGSEELLAEIAIVESVRVVEADESFATIEVAAGEKCPRCWNVRELGVDPAHPEVCERCARVLTEIGR